MKLLALNSLIFRSNVNLNMNEKKFAISSSTRDNWWSDNLMMISWWLHFYVECLWASLHFFFCLCFFFCLNVNTSTWLLFQRVKIIIIQWFSFFLIISLCLKVSDYAFHSCFNLVSKASISFKTFFIFSLNIHWLYFTEYSFHCIL